MRLPKRRLKLEMTEVPEGVPLREFFVWWMDLSAHDFRDLRKCLARADREEDMQRFLTNHPNLLAAQLAGGHGRWVIPKKRLGAEHIPDFVVGERSSAGFEWFAVELKSPKAKMFTKAGDPTHQLTHAMRQIDDWRAWLQTNQNYAARPQGEGGLGLTDISASLDGLILIGRPNDTDEATHSRRREMFRRSRIKIHSYDWLLGSGQLSNLPVRRIAE
jgi:hypothetical protein